MSVMGAGLLGLGAVLGAYSATPTHQPENMRFEALQLDASQNEILEVAQEYSNMEKFQQFTHEEKVATIVEYLQLEYRSKFTWINQGKVMSEWLDGLGYCYDGKFVRLGHGWLNENMCYSNPCCNENAKWYKDISITTNQGGTCAFTKNMKDRNVWCNGKPDYAIIRKCGPGNRPLDAPDNANCTP